MPTDSERLARIEVGIARQGAQLAAVKETLDKAVESNTKNHEFHFEMGRQFIAFRSKLKGMWAAVVVIAAAFGSLGAMAAQYFSGHK